MEQKELIIENLSDAVLLGLYHDVIKEVKERELNTVKGWYYDKRKNLYYSQFNRKSLGYFISPEKAREAYLKAKFKHDITI